VHPGLHTGAPAEHLHRVGIDYVLSGPGQKYTYSSEALTGDDGVECRIWQSYQRGLWKSEIFI
jgi:hypothetical protein